MSIKLLGKFELSCVVFVRDYLQFVFEGDGQNFTLNTLTLPTTAICKKTYDSHSLGWRDALCSLINKIVKTAIVEERDSIKIIFDNGDMLEISLKEEDYEGPEAAILFESNGHITVW